ncbi:allophanate hydrolase [Paenibacillus algorifonticola]|uniref:Allophanate hydrolase n=1 Tax=Paenibacillus algorifonticola TaxID=684063 RepID=A0A1I2IKP5_9BACL|nr:allophanate hydrolase [Paenibacillus algorifonticola]SFF42972.1 allophanate hydrolase [Paenibacillus algorifonticola]
MTAVTFPEMLTMQWLREKYAAQQLAPEAVIEEVISRSERDAAMNIWITPPTLARLRPYLERLALLDPAKTPLWGIPFAVKDNIDVAGLPTTAACAEFAYTPDENATVVERLVRAGAIPLGKTNLDQFATGLVGMRSPYGEAHNALRPELISGGSSSGSAVAVARGQAVFSLGTDTAGSGRVPAALNGLVGYKPSLGAWPTKGVVPACASLDCVTVFAHSIDDALAVDSSARGVDLADPWSREVIRSASGLPSKLYLPQERPTFYGPFADEYAQAWDGSVRQLLALGLAIEYVDCSLFAEAAAELYEGPWVAERWADLGDFIESHPGVAVPATEQVLRSGAAERHTAASVFDSMHRLQAFKLAAKALLGDAVLVMPTCGGTWTREQVRELPIQTNTAMGAYTNHCNLLDLSAVALPSGEAAERLPFGITLFALADREHLLEGLGKLYASRTMESGWSGREEYSPNNAFAAVAESDFDQTTLVAVCGLHMRGFALEQQMLAFGATFVKEAKTAAKYELIKLHTMPAKPGMIKLERGGVSVALELWRMPLARFGEFAALIPAPLGIGKVELEDGAEVPGFICEGYALEQAERISEYGGWRKYQQAISIM